MMMTENKIIDLTLQMTAIESSTIMPYLSCKKLRYV